MGLIKIIYYVPRLNETIKIINSGIIFVAGEWSGLLHCHVPEQRCTGLDINMLRNAKSTQIVTNLFAGKITRCIDSATLKAWY
jgi:hypothetical protein